MPGINRLRNIESEVFKNIFWSGLHCVVELIVYIKLISSYVTLAQKVT